ncbi:unnamed protein product [Dicrocoelium dendriticum]|nr:unnamed protein product [Dicrocoelium dendriticum]
MCLVTVMLFCCKRPKTGPFCEPGRIVRSRKSRTPHKTLENSEVHLCAGPHPFLPPSLHEVASVTGPTRVDHIDSTRHNTSSAAPESVVLLMRQESASHRDCELPPVPPGGEIKQQSRYSICDDLPSESDGLYASVGHSGNVRSGLQCEERSINAAAAASSGQLICAGQRDSVADSANAPYYSSVASVLAPNYYGELPEPGSLRPYDSSTPLGSSQHENLYARVRPCVGRSGHSQPQTSVETPCLTDTGDALSSPSHASDSPPLPERAYGQSAIELVDHTRASNLHFLPTSVSSTSSAYPASPQLGRLCSCFLHP